MNSVQLAKFSVPDHSRSLIRHRLFDLLDDLAGYPLLWFASPAGSGKTSLVASYLLEKRISPLWYKVDEGDNDIASFFYHLSLLPGPVPEGKTLPLFTPESASDLHGYARNFFRIFFTLVPTNSTLIFDDYQELVSDSPMHELMTLMLAEMPEGLRCMVISRQPPTESFARAKVSRELFYLDWNELKLTELEALALARHLSGNEEMTAQEVQPLFQQSQGWVAGLVLMLQSPDAVLPQTRGLDDSYQVLFDYFSHEVFSGLPQTCQLFLVKTALLPELTTSLAIQVSGEKEGAAYLSSLVHNQYFTSAYAALANTYCYHPMFKQFLLEKGKTLLPGTARRTIQRQAADDLLGKGRYDEAMSLLYASCSWQEYMQQLVRCAPVMMGQGRGRQLQQWIDRLPERYRSQPWPQFWQGSIVLPVEPLTARPYFENALQLFEVDQQEEGMFLSWAAIVDSFIFAWDDFRPLDRWIAWMDEKVLANRDFPSPQIAAKVTFGMFVALMYRQPHHPDMALWAGRVNRLLDELVDDNQRIAMAAFYLHYLGTIGELANAGLLLERLEPCATPERVQAVNLIPWYQSKAMFHWLSADFSASQQAIDAGLALADESGVHLWDFVLRVQAGYVGFDQASAAERQQLLQQVRSIMDEHGRLHRSHYYYLASLEALISGNPIRAQEHIRQSLSASEALGTPFPVTLCHIAMARVLIELGEFEQVNEHLQQAVQLVKRSGSAIVQFNIALVRAELAMKKQDATAMADALSEAMGLGRQHGYFNSDYWRPYAMTELARQALELGVEVDYVQELVRRRHLQPETPPFDLANWPWKIQIFTLGRFGVMLDGHSLAVDDRGKNKPLLLLKALIAFGGREVSEETLCEALWPDAEGDVVHSTFTTNLNRLRKLLSREALLMQGGCLSLNDHLCWVDGWALERVLGDLEQQLTMPNPEPDVIALKIETVLSLYKGHFLSHRQQAPWMMAPRERLRAKVVRGVDHVITYYEALGKHAKTIPLYENVLAWDELSEPHYRGLMKSYVALGEPIKALVVYERCREILQVKFHIGPSIKTEQLYLNIKSEVES